MYSQNSNSNKHILLSGFVWGGRTRSSAFRSGASVRNFKALLHRVVVVIVVAASWASASADSSGLTPHSSPSQSCQWATVKMALGFGGGA